MYISKLIIHTSDANTVVSNVWHAPRDHRCTYQVYKWGVGMASVFTTSRHRRLIYFARLILSSFIPSFCLLLLFIHVSRPPLFFRLCPSPFFFFCICFLPFFCLSSARVRLWSSLFLARVVGWVAFVCGRRVAAAAVRIIEKTGEKRAAE